MFCFMYVDFLSKTLYLYLAPQYFSDEVHLVVTLIGRILIIHCSHPLHSVKSVIIVYDCFQTLPLVSG